MQLNRALLVKFFLELRASYWFVPSVMVLGSVVLSVFTIWLDAQFSDDWPREVPFIFSNQAEGARSLLATVAGSMITVAGVTFSLTLLAVSHATGQFGPRLLNNFMRDRGNQVTLGTFVSTFIYCLLVLRTVRSADEQSTGDPSLDSFGAFVPHISVTLGLVLALCSVGVLIYFIHHVPESIRLSHVVSDVGRQLCDAIDELFPEMIAQPEERVAEQPQEDPVPDDFYRQAIPIRRKQSGYVQSIDDAGLLDLAKKRDVAIFIKHRPGDFYSQGTPLILVSPAENVTEEDRDQLQLLFALGDRRTLSQNATFAVDQLVQVAQRALSPGVNDPQTAVVCLDWLKVGLLELARRRTPSEYRFDEDGDLRVFTRPQAFCEFCDRVFDQLRQYVAADRNATFHMMAMINDLEAVVTEQRQRACLVRHSEKLLDAFSTAGHPDFEVQTLRGIKSKSVEKEFPISAAPVA